ncbi:MAG TPA: glycosyltransferase family 4 protein [Solirubrobacteraceae bacterium]|nr:glycosyltransferase family 4 protein [Solirubrobacteraceae bacterium]
MTGKEVGANAERIRELHRRGVLLVEQGGRGGVADYTGCLARSLAKRGIPITVATADDHLYGATAGVSIVPVFGYVRGRSSLARRARDLGLGRLLNGLRFLLALPRLARLARGRAVVHVQGWERTSLGLAATALLLACGARIVYTSHNTFERRRRAVDGTWIFSRLARHTIVHTAGDRPRVSGPASVIAHGHYGGVADGAAPVSPAAARTALGLPTDPPVVLLFGVLRSDKGLDDLLAAAVQAPRWRVLVAGKEDGALHAARAALGHPELAERVTIREGFHGIDEVAGFFAAADLVALPYHRVSQSGVLQLAYGFARPVVAYPVGGLPEAIIEGETGWLCAEAAPAALAAVLREADAAGREELRRRGEAGRSWAVATLDWDTIAAATEAVYASALRLEQSVRRA